MAGAVIRVAIADDDPQFRDALVDVLGSDPRFLVVGQADSAEEIVDIVAGAAPDLILLDVRMPGGGPAAARAVTAMAQRTSPGNMPVTVAISAQAGVAQVLGMVRAGASGYLQKGRVGADLPDLLARSANGEVVLAVPFGAEALRHLTAGAWV